MAARVAAILGASWCDLDERIAAGAGKPVTRIFAEDGEATFRALESRAMLSALDEGSEVIAAGGGWAAQPGNLEAVGGRTLTIYLAVHPSVAARRLAGSDDRPLLEAGAREEQLAAQLAQRESWYRLADLAIQVDDASPEMVAEAVAVAARQYGGW